MADNGSDALTVPAHAGSFQFAMPIASAQPFAVTVQTQPSNPSQTCTVDHGSGVMGGSDITNVAVTCTTNSGYKITGTVSGLSGSGLVLSEPTAGTVAVSQSGSFQFPNGLTSGNAFTVSVKSNPTHPLQACSANPASGTVGGTDVSVSVTCRTPVDEVIVGDTVRITGFPIDPTTGSVGPASASAAATASYDQLLTTDPGGRHVYIASPNGLEMYAADPRTGALTAVVGSPFYPGLALANAIFEPSGHFLITGGGSSAGAYSFSIDAATGIPTKVAGSPFAQPATPPGYSPFVGGLAFIGASPSHVYWLQPFYGCSCGQIEGYSIDVATGTLSALGATNPILDGSPVSAGVVDPSNSFLFYYLHGSIVTYAIDASAGTLTSTSSVTVGQNAGASRFALTPAGRFLYYVQGGDGAGILGFAINSANGALTAIQGSPFANQPGTRPGAIASSRSGTFLYALDGNGHLLGFAIDAVSGALAPLPGSPFAVDAQSYFLATVSLQ